MSLVDRGDVFDAELPGLGVRPVVIVSRQVAIPVLSNVAAALVTSTVRGHPAEVSLGAENGLNDDCVANCDNVVTLPKRRLVRRRGSLSFAQTEALDRALRFALGLE